jgi:hypothetical protein
MATWLWPGPRFWTVKPATLARTVPFDDAEEAHPNRAAGNPPAGENFLLTAAGFSPKICVFVEFLTELEEDLMANSKSYLSFAVVCLVSLLFVAPALFADGLVLASPAPPADQPEVDANQATIQQLLTEGEAVPIPGLTPQPSARAVCENHHFATTCFNCWRFCPKLGFDCEGVCSIQGGTEWCDCTNAYPL